MSYRPTLILLVSVLSCRTADEMPLYPPVAPERPAGTGGNRGRPMPTETPTTGTGGAAPTSGTGGMAVAGTGGSAGSDGGDAAATPGSGGASGSDAGTVAVDTGSVGEAGNAAAGTWSHTACNKATLMYPRIDRNNGVFPPGSCPPPESLRAQCPNNSKLKATAALSSAFETGYVHPPEYASDEHLMTRWSSPTGATAWVRLDFGSEQTFQRVFLLWELAHAADYDVQSSNNGMTWTTIGTVRNGDGFQDIVDVNGKGRYLRINGIRRGATGGMLYGYSLFDLSVCSSR